MLWTYVELVILERNLDPGRKMFVQVPSINPFLISVPRSSQALTPSTATSISLY